MCIAARKTADLAMIKALGFDSIHIIGKYNRKIFNKNELIRTICLLENVNDVIVE